MLQNLNILVAEVDMGSLVKQDEPNYALLSQVTHTIRAFLDSVSFVGRHGSSQLTGGARWTQGAELLSPHIDLANLDFEIEFWQNLAGYSSFLEEDPAGFVSR